MARLTPRTRIRQQPLWLRVERNRARLTLFLLGFCLSAALAAQAIVTLPLAGALSLLYASVAVTTLSPGSHPWFHEVSWLLAHLLELSLGIGAVAAVCAAFYEMRTLTRPLRSQLGAIGATFVPLGEMMTTKHALKDISIAAGVDPAPELFAIESASLNAFLIARGSQRPVCAVTTGLIERLDGDEQRAVFANLLARLISGDIAWATSVSALMAPLWRWRDADLSADEHVDDVESGRFIAGERSGLTYVSTLARSPKVAAWGSGLVWLSLLGYVTYIAAVVASELVGAGHRKAHLVSAETADAEGMLLLKDPPVMLRALRKAVEADNRVRLAVPMYAGLFYVWAGDDLADDDDPEWVRLDRLREVVGVDGLADAVGEAREACAEAEALDSLLPPPPPIAERRKAE